MAQPPGQQGPPGPHDPSGPGGSPGPGGPSGPGDPRRRPRPLSRLRPPWRDHPRRAEMVVWTAVGFVALWLVTVVSLVVVVNLAADHVWLAGIPLLLMLVAGAVCAGTAWPRFRAVGYGILLALLVQVGMVALAVIVLAGICGLFLARQ